MKEYSNTDQFFCKERCFVVVKVHFIQFCSFVEKVNKNSYYGEV